MKVFIKGFVRPRIFDISREKNQWSYGWEFGWIQVMRVDRKKEGLDSVWDEYAAFGAELAPIETIGKVLVNTITEFLQDIQ